ncbi:MAG TPA: TatD family hydrolase [Patescibacteria group bacterium]|nr:TatD family hydrolase [Patescibacteria group bacterium]
MFDTHAHVNFADFKNDADEVMQRAKEKKMTLINVGSQISTSRRAVEMAEKYSHAYAAVGLHPIQLEDIDIKEEHAEFHSRKEEFNPENYRVLADGDKVVAIGECGLDFYHIYEPERKKEIVDKQKKVFKQQIELADQVDLPMIIHCRGSKDKVEDAYYDLLKILKQKSPKKRGVLHCYIGPPELVSEFLDLGFYLGFNGVITFDKTGKTEEIILKTPKNRILTETDCPYLTPVPYRGRRNEPIYVEFVLEKLAQIKEKSKEEMENITENNARRLFLN